MGPAFGGPAMTGGGMEDDDSSVVVIGVIPAPQ